MSVDEHTVQYIAKLARIEKPVGDELKGLVDDLNNILAWVEQLEELSTENVEPMTSVVDASLRVRADIVTDGGYPEDIVENARDARDNFFVVPQVVE